MATVTFDAATSQVRPWPAGGTWNTLSQGGSGGGKVTQKNTTWGVTLRTGYAPVALGAANQWVNSPSAGTALRMAQEQAHAVGLELRGDVALATGQTGTGATTNVFDRGEQSGQAIITIVTTVGATPTCTYQVEGSPDGTSFSPLSSADSGTPTTFSTATFVITSATTTTRIVNPASGSARFIRLTMSANTNVTNTIDVAAV
jgi:hypothetical protein